MNKYGLIGMKKTRSAHSLGLFFYKVRSKFTALCGYTGKWYLSRIREVEPKKGNPFLSFQIAALTGSKDDPEYRYFDVNVVVMSYHLVRILFLDYF